MSDDELERLHLLATLRTYGPAPAAFIRERANGEAAHDAFDSIDTIVPQAIGLKLSVLRTLGWASQAEGHWDITGDGVRALEARRDALDGVVLAEGHQAEIERLKALDEAIAADRDEARALVRRFVDLHRDKDGDVPAQPGASECDDLLIEAMEMLERVGR